VFFFIESPSPQARGTYYAADAERRRRTRAQRRRRAAPQARRSHELPAVCYLAVLYECGVPRRRRYAPAALAPAALAPVIPLNPF
jgi:hypothetical protein